MANWSIGGAGAIVVTDLTNYGMPFIRYKVGDVGVPSAKTSCPCGCTYPIMESLEGRVADYVVTPDGNYISGISLTENFAMHLPGSSRCRSSRRNSTVCCPDRQGESFAEQTVADLARLAHERFGDPDALGDRVRRFDPVGKFGQVSLLHLPAAESLFVTLVLAVHGFF